MRIVDAIVYLVNTIKNEESVCAIILRIMVEASGPGEPGLPRREEETETVWEEVIREIDTQSTSDGIPANMREWSSPIRTLGERVRMNVKPMMLTGPGGRVAVLESNLYMGTDHVETCVAIVGWKRDNPLVIAVVVSPVGPLTPLTINPLDFGRHALKVVKDKRQILIPTSLPFQGLPGRAN